MDTTAASPTTHILVYPYPSSGHTIPSLHLIHHLLLQPNLTLTVLLIPSNATLLTPLLPLFPTTLHTLLLHPPDLLPFTGPSHKQDIFAKMFTLRELNAQIISWFDSHPSPPVAIISDFFLGWTTKLADQLGIKRLVFSPSGALDLNIMNSLWLNRPQCIKPSPENSGFSFPKLPGSPVFSTHHLSNLCPEIDPEDQEWNDFTEFWSDNMASYGVVVNSLTELESVHFDYLKTQLGHSHVWAVGPLASLTERVETAAFHEVITWLDRKEDDSVVYVCFGSRTIMTRQQMEAVSIGLDRSGVDFVLCLGNDTTVDFDVVLEGYEDRVNGRGLVLKGWAPQMAILSHRAVGSFVTHCGWNSVLEGLSAGVVMLTWPMGAEQFVNARLLVDELGVGIRLGESSQKVPDADEVARVVIKAVRGSGMQRKSGRKLQELVLAAVNGGSSKMEWDEMVKSLTQLGRG
ncbi:unnamed protein product [Rhodiola kirilowii]